jgi:hypothetical protein
MNWQVNMAKHRQRAAPVAVENARKHFLADRYERKLKKTERCLKQHNAGAKSAHAR